MTDEHWQAEDILELCCPIQWPLATRGCLSFNWIKIKIFRSSIILTTFQVLSSHIWLVATILGISDIKHFLHCRKFCWTYCFWMWKSWWIISKPPNHRGSFTELWNKNFYWVHHILAVSFYIVYIASYLLIIWACLYLQGQRYSDTKHYIVCLEMFSYTTQRGKWQMWVE